MRCDGRIGGCENCLRLDFECSLSKPELFQEQAGHSTAVSGGKGISADGQLRLERRRVSIACFQCRHKKAKCSGDLPSCQRCLRRHVQCQYPSSSKRAAYDFSVARSVPSQCSPDTGSPLERSCETSVLPWSHYPLPSPVSSLER